MLHEKEEDGQETLKLLQLESQQCHEATHMLLQEEENDEWERTCVFRAQAKKTNSLSALPSLWRNKPILLVCVRSSGQEISKF